MKTLVIIFFGVMKAVEVSAQISNTNYALPADATGVENVVSNVPGSMLSLSEGGTVPGDTKSTCDGKKDGVFKSSSGLTLQHYYDKEMLQQTAAAYVSLGGMKGLFKQSVEAEYGGLENDVNIARLGGFVKKGKLVTEQGKDVEVMYYVLTHNCVENTNATATKIVYHVMLLTDSNYALITNEIYSETPDKAKKYAEEILTRIRALDYEAVK